MRQEEIMVKLKELLQTEQELKKKTEIKPLIDSLREMQKYILLTDQKSSELRKEIKSRENKVIELEKMIQFLNERTKDYKEKLYGNKGGSLKELLSFQQSVQKMEQDSEQAEIQLLDELKSIEDGKKEREELRKANNDQKSTYNELLEDYRSKSAVIEAALKENLLCQAQFKQMLKPEHLNLLEETIKRFPSSPIAVLTGETCSGCHISLPTILLSNIREGKRFYRCDNCGRIIINII